MISSNFLSEISSDWSLFLDRDGVINVERKDDYVRQWHNFIFCENALTALKIINPLFNRIVIVTNQRGVEKKLMDISDLKDIHEKMKQEIHAADGRIDQVFYCTSLSDDDHNRKPNPGMAFQAKTTYPEIDLHKSIMIGNSSSDMHFGRNCGMKTVFVTNNDSKLVNNELVDLFVKDLHAFSKLLIG